VGLQRLQIGSVVVAFIQRARERQGVPMGAQHSRDALARGLGKLDWIVANRVHGQAGDDNTIKLLFAVSARSSDWYSFGRAVTTMTSETVGLLTKRLTRCRTPRVGNPSG